MIRQAGPRFAENDHATPLVWRGQDPFELARPAWGQQVDEGKVHVSRTPALCHAR
jgi:hypothetical protein